MRHAAASVCSYWSSKAYKLTYFVIGDGNIGDKHVSPTARTDVDVVPDVATRIPEEEDVHTGRGGAGNVKLLPEHQHKKVVDGVPHDGASTSHGSVADKLKHKVLGLFK